MASQMVNGNKRLARSKGKPLCIVYAHKQCPDKSGCIGDGDCLKVIKGGVCIAEGLFNHLRNRFGVAA